MKLPLCNCECGKQVKKLGNRFIQGHNQGFSGHKHSPASIGKQRIAMFDNQNAKGYKFSPDQIENQRTVLFGNQNALGSKRSPEQIEKMRIDMLGNQNAKKWLSSLTYEELLELTKNARIVCNANSSSIEIKIAEVLDKLNIDYEIHKPMGAYIVDFYVPSKNLIIECDGEYWHGLPGAKKRDRKKDRFLRKQGYEVLRLKENEINKVPELTLVEGLKGVNDGRRKN